MKIVIFISFVLCFSACTKMDEDTEIVGSFANALCGYEGTVTYADGRPAKNYPLQMFIGHSFTTIDSATGDIKSNAGLNNFAVNGKTDANGQYKILTANKTVNANLSSGFTPLGLLKFSNFEYFQPELLVNNVGQEHMSVPSVYGRVQKIDVKLHEFNKLHIDSKNIKVDYDNIFISGKSISPISGKEVDIIVHSGARVWYSVHQSKPNSVVDLTVTLYKNGQWVDRRNVRVLMDKKDNYLEMQ